MVVRGRVRGEERNELISECPVSEAGGSVSMELGGVIGWSGLGDCKWG